MPVDDDGQLDARLAKLAADCKQNIQRLDRIHDLFQAAEAKLAPTVNFDPLYMTDDDRLMQEAQIEYNQMLMETMMQSLAVPAEIVRNEPDTDVR